jgi:hypothetical protein
MFVPPSPCAYVPQVRFVSTARVRLEDRGRVTGNPEIIHLDKTSFAEIWHTATSATNPSRVRVGDADFSSMWNGFVDE